MALSLASGTASPGPANKPSQSQILARSVQSRGGPSIVFDLSACDVEVNERKFLELRSLIYKKSFPNFSETQGIVLKGMNKDGKKGSQVFSFLSYRR